MYANLSYQPLGSVQVSYKIFFLGGGGKGQNAYVKDLNSYLLVNGLASIVLPHVGKVLQNNFCLVECQTNYKKLRLLWLKYCFS